MKINRSLGIFVVTLVVTALSVFTRAEETKSTSEPSSSQSEPAAAQESDVNQPMLPTHPQEPVEYLGEEELEPEVEPVEFEKQPQLQSLFFDPKLNNVEMPRQSVDYDLIEPDKIRLGPLEMTGRDVQLHFTREEVEFWELAFGLHYTKWKSRIYFLSFRWPMDYITTGRIEILNDKSQTLWAREITDKDLTDWENFLEKDPQVEEVPTKGYKALPNSDSDLLVSGKKLSRSHRGTQFGLYGKELLSIPIWRIKEPFRFCVIQDSSEGRLATCSRRYRFHREVGRYFLKVVSQNVRPRVAVNNKPVTLKGSAIFLDDHSPIKFATLLSSGTYFEFISSPKEVSIVDLIQTEDGKYGEAIGYGHMPLGEVEIIDRSKEDFWSFLNFMPTIGDSREFWRARFPLQEPFLFFKGKGGAAFRQSFIFEKLPSKRFRPRIARTSKESTYLEHPVIKGQVDSSVQVRSNESSAEKVSDNEFVWNYYAPKRGQLHRSLLLVEDEGESWQAYHEIYRGYPREVAFRLTGVLSNELELVFLGEVATQWWFESLLGWDNYRFSNQRWGFAAKYFQSFASLGKKEEGASLIKLQVTTLDLKYRLTPGVWNRDPTVGLMLNAQSVVLEEFDAMMAGGGVFWARSMPAIFDRLLNWLPFMDYPKWVDMEFIYYPMPLSPQTQLGVNFSMNFHGKIQWGEQFYGEAGFGLKSFVIRDLDARKKIGAGAAYGTLGLGYNF